MVRLRGIEPLLPGWKPGVLTTKRKPHNNFNYMVDPAGLEPATARLWAECSNQLSYGSLMACLKRFELLAHGLEGRCSILLSYRHTSSGFLLNKMVSHTGIEPVTPWLKVKCSTDWANDSHYGAGNEVRTRDIQLGRLTLYQLSYSRTSLSLLFTLVAEAGFEPTTFGLWARRATRLLYSAIFKWCLGPDSNRHGIAPTGF